MVNDKAEFELDKDAFIKANDLYMALMKFSPDGILNWGYPGEQGSAGQRLGGDGHAVGHRRLPRSAPGDLLGQAGLR